MAGIQAKVEFPELNELRKAFLQFRPSIARKHMGAAIRRSLKPALNALRGNVRRGPTGNLKRAIASKVKTYKSGSAVGLVGFVAAGSGKNRPAGGGTVRKGKDLAYHAGFLEFGTKRRKTKGAVASSYKRLGPFQIKPIAKRGKFKGVVRVQTNPKYPRAFFKRAPAGKTVDLREMPVGGSLGQPPIRTAYRESLSQTRRELSGQMALALQKALKDLAANFPPKRSLKDIGPLPF